MKFTVSKGTIFALVAWALLSACAKNDSNPVNAYSKIGGTWQIKEVIVIGDVKKDDGSTISFNNLSSINK
ncbi:MAG: hypothetical protein HC819_24115 [Cyclobacteriaceae bacterium]|nr:hypothetical protein [Cyclobacteriaceae bacterium]